MRSATLRIWTLLAPFVLVTAVVAADDEDKPASSTDKVTVAVLTFEAEDPGNPKIGSQLSEMVTAVLSGGDQFELVDRASLGDILAENELNLTGLVSADQAIQVGKLVGAKLMVMGRAFALGKNFYITAKIVGTETSRVEAVMIKGTPKDDVGELTMKLCEKVDERIVQRGQALTGADLVLADPLPALVEAASALKKKPVFAIVVSEEHRASRAGSSEPPDPAVETELKRWLAQAGFTIKDVPQNELTDWADSAGDGKIEAWPRSLEGVDLVITGEALSEYASRIAALTNCVARAEVNVISRKDGRIVLAERRTTRAVDLAETLAGKAALQKAGHQLAVPIFEYLLETGKGGKKKAKKGG